MFSLRVVGLVGDEFSAAGSFVPVGVEDANADDDGYVLYLVENVVDCVDVKQSSKPKKSRDPLKKTVFRPEALPRELSAFRIPETPGAVYWNGWAVDRLTELMGDDLGKRLVWSEDAAANPHPNPMGF
ncbi:hypothetical protein [Streptomyces sp. NPDC047108]|uniref:hypothetical protein n=1 Tax=Streptomyces sp. NPDC047108 TaxID=3155025 RepID=UPI00340FB714